MKQYFYNDQLLNCAIDKSKKYEYVNIPYSIGIATTNDDGRTVFHVYETDERGFVSHEKQFSNSDKALVKAKIWYSGLISLLGGVYNAQYDQPEAILNEDQNDVNPVKINEILKIRGRKKREERIEQLRISNEIKRVNLLDQHEALPNYPFRFKHAMSMHTLAHKRVAQKRKLSKNMRKRMASIVKKESQ